jgi:DNA adenine methylase
MKYMGSKNRIAKYLLPIILKNRQPGQYYIEPFVGGANMIDKVPGNRIGSDINEYVIKGLETIQNNLDIIPTCKAELSEIDYRNIKKNKNHELHGYCSFQLSYGGKFWGGYCRDKELKRDYIAEGYRNALKQSPLLHGLILLNKSFLELEMPSNSIIYCDPPYRGTTGYKGKFEHDIFFSWCRDKSREGHSVFISEYSAPADFECVWHKEINSSLTKNTGSKKGVERLFKI